MGFVLGINGAAGAGKDTMADYLVSKYCWTKKLSFARNLKELCKAAFNLSEFQVDDQEGKGQYFESPKLFTPNSFSTILNWMYRTHQNYPTKPESVEKVVSLFGTEMYTPRHILQIVGTDICRELVPSYHVDILLQEIKANDDGWYVITDVRFPNEGNIIIKELGGKVILLRREKTSVDNINRKHPSEVAMLDWGRFDEIIDNNRDGLNYLYEEVDNLVRRQNLCPLAITQSNEKDVKTSFLSEEAVTPRDT